MPVLMCFSGLPGVGKSTIARRLAQESGALWLWIDEIETAMRASHMRTDDLADGGYAAAQAVARGVLRQGYNVIADCVNPIVLTRKAWEQVSSDTGARHLNVEFVCSDMEEHQRRVKQRSVSAPGCESSEWEAILQRDYTPMTEAEIRIDTAVTSAEQAVFQLCAAIRVHDQES
ncbi:AAA family ATPase [Leisingera sp. S232]|uniref:AAA family ATPase n=1 Tax=Leisingera sp. S232 TaxID=3415132 RepID=UPI003C7E0F7C